MAITFGGRDKAIAICNISHPNQLEVLLVTGRSSISKLAKKVEGVVNLYLGPSDNAVVICIDEK